MAKRTLRNFVELIEEVNEKGEVTKSKTFLSPAFTPGDKLVELQVKMKKVEDNDFDSEKDALNYMADIIVDYYNKQFTRKQFISGTHAPELMDVIKDQIEFISQGSVTEENKKRLHELLK
ncbi:hypothetical protein [Staphylococcus phage vB_SauS_IMEP5]|nr:hypothetical protein [Staphylococcus phage vB_SauS_IMEP5]